MPPLTVSSHLGSKASHLENSLHANLLLQSRLGRGHGACGQLPACGRMRGISLEVRASASPPPPPSYAATASGSAALPAPRFARCGDVDDGAATGREGGDGTAPGGEGCPFPRGERVPRPRDAGRPRGGTSSAGATAVIFSYFRHFPFLLQWPSLGLQQKATCYLAITTEFRS